MAKKTIDTRPLADLGRETAAVVQAVGRTNRPVVLTADGQPAAVLLSPKAYRRLRATARRRTLEDLELMQSLADAAAGNTRPAAEVFDELAAKYGIKPAP